jgi:hypothetical protein
MSNLKSVSVVSAQVWGLLSFRNKPRIYNELHHKNISISKDLVGINTGMEEMIKLLGTMLDNVHFLGIWRMGGISKTTMA